MTSQQRRPVERPRYGYVSSYRAGRLPQAPPPEPKKSRYRTKLKIWLVVFLIVGFGAQIGWSRHVSAHALAVARADAALAAARQRRISSVPAAINQIIAQNTAIDFSVSVEGAGQSGTALSHFGDPTDFDAASTGKLVTAADFLHHVEDGTASLSNNLDGESAGDWLQAMIVNSDDTAWQELNDFLTHPDLSNYASAIGLSQYSPDDNQLTSNDIANLLQKLYDGKLLNTTDTSLLLSYMKRANFRSYIIPAVPVGDTVYHKVGIDNDDVHDAAIITNGKQSVVLVIFTNGNGTYNWTARADIMQQITKIVTAAYLS
jgi:beta-lactamase class A